MTGSMRARKTVKRTKHPHPHPHPHHHQQQQQRCGGMQSTAGTKQTHTGAKEGVVVLAGSLAARAIKSLISGRVMPPLY